MTNADMKVKVAAAMKSYLTSQDFKDIIAKAVKEAVGQAVESMLKEHSRPQRPRSFWSAPRIATSGHIQQRKSAIHGLPVTLRML